MFTVCGGRNLNAESRRSVLRQFCYYFFSYRQGRHPMVGGIWNIRRRDVRRAAVTDDEALRFYLGGRRFGAILRGDGGGFRHGASVNEARYRRRAGFNSARPLASAKRQRAFTSDRRR